MAKVRFINAVIVATFLLMTNYSLAELIFYDGFTIQMPVWFELTPRIRTPIVIPYKDINLQGDSSERVPLKTKLPEEANYQQEQTTLYPLIYRTYPPTITPSEYFNTQELNATTAPTSTPAMESTTQQQEPTVDDIIGTK